MRKDPPHFELLPKIHFCQIEHIFDELAHVDRGVLDAGHEIALQVVQGSGLPDKMAKTIDGG